MSGSPSANSPDTMRSRSRSPPERKAWCSTWDSSSPCAPQLSTVSGTARNLTPPASEPGAPSFSHDAARGSEPSIGHQPLQFLEKVHDYLDRNYGDTVDLGFLSGRSLDCYERLAIKVALRTTPDWSSERPSPLRHTCAGSSWTPSTRPPPPGEPVAPPAPRKPQGFSAS